jgi:hypothetical protein
VVHATPRETLKGERLRDTGDRMQTKKDKSLVLSVVDSMTYVALWQGAAFILLILLVWFNELVDLPSLIAGRPASPPDVFRGCISTAGVLFGAIVTIGHTYVQHRNVVSGLLTICSYCHKIQINQTMWQRIEEYIGKHSTALFSHGVCPECFARAVRDNDLKAPSGGEI